MLKLCFLSFETKLLRLASTLTGRLSSLTISPLYVDRFGRSLRFCYLEFDKKVISDGSGVKMLGIGARGFEF